MEMKKIFSAFMPFLLITFFGFSSYGGMESGMKGEGHKMEGAHEMGMGDHSTMGDQLFRASAFGTNVKGSMVDIKAKMAKMGKGMPPPAGVTHHLMLTPEKPLGDGVAAKVTILYPGGEKKEVTLTTMGEHIGSDLNLNEKGKYQFDCTMTRGTEETSFAFEYEVN